MNAGVRRSAAVLLVVFSAACRSSGPTAPTGASEPPVLSLPTPPPAPKPIYPPESWALIASVTSVTPHPCWRDLTGLTSDYPLIVHRAEAMRLFVYWDYPFDGIEYVGSLSGQDFSLAASFNRGASFPLGCLRGGQVEVILTGRVSGRFSDDSRSISAEEVLSYRLVRTGEQVDVRYRWAATAPGTGSEIR